MPSSKSSNTHTANMALQPSLFQQKPLRCALAYTLSLLFIWQPMLLAAQPLTATHQSNGRPTVDQAANGVPVINIQNPNSNGLSHNFYNDFNVDSSGLILNNSKQLTQTQLGGYIEGNPNLSNGTASLILNEVISNNPSSLNGYIEVGGARADVVVANPNGISCNGCGFINTNHATLSTGQPIMNNGALSGFDVQQGAISILGDGLNAANTSRFDIIARSVEIAGELHADTLNIVTGQQTVDHASLATTNITTDANKPSFAIDSTALGGMYANRIRLIANEEGVGVRLDAPVAAQNGDLKLSANGNIAYTNLASTKDITIDAGEYAVSGTGTAVATGNVQVNAGSITNTGTLGGHQSLTLNAADIVNDAGGALLSGGDITLSADTVINRLGDIYALSNTDDSPGNIRIYGRDGSTPAQRVENRSGRIQAQGDLTIEAEELLNVRDVLDWDEKLVEGNLYYYCTDCSGENLAVIYTFTEHFFRSLDEATTERSILSADGNMNLSGSTLTNNTSDILSLGDITLGFNVIENLGLHSGEYIKESRYYRHRNYDPFTDTTYYLPYIYGPTHESYVIGGISPYNSRNYHGGAQYFSDGSNEDLEYMRLLPDRENTRYDPDNLLLREDNIIHRNFELASTEIKKLESTNILRANILAGGNLNTGTAEIINTDFGDERASDVAADQINRLSAISQGGIRDSYLNGVNGGLFSIASPDHPYLVETNPFFASANGLLGSAYLLNRLEWDPDGAVRLIGDGFYEQQLIRQQIIDLTGRASLSPQHVDANKQYRTLLDNGFYAAESLELAIGVSLTAEQINKLTTDIVWMIEQEVAGEIVLVPKLYLSPNSVVIDNKSGALMAAGNNFINDGGSVFNTGTMHAGNDILLDLDENGLRNVGGNIIADNILRIDSEGDIQNISGTLQGKQVDIASIGNIINQRWSLQRDFQAAGVHEWETSVGSAAQIIGADAVSLNAGGDITVAGSRISGGEVSLDANGNINIETVVNHSGRKGNYYGGTLSESRVRHISSDISSTISLIANAANDLTVIGSHLASDGDIKLSSGNDLIIASAANSDSYNFLARHDGETTHSIDRSIRHQSSTVAGQGNVTLESGNNLSVIASRLEAAEDLSLMGVGDIELLAERDSDYRYRYEEDDGSFGRNSTESFETHRQTVVGSELGAKGNVYINSSKDRFGNLVGYDKAAGDVTITATQITSDEDMFIASGGSLTVDSAANTYTNEHHKTKTGTVSSRLSGESTLAITHQGSGLNSANNLQLMALDGITLQNADLNAMNDMTVSAGLFTTAKKVNTNDQATLTIEDVQDIYQYDRYKETSKTDIGGIIASAATLGLSGGVASFNPMSFVDMSRATVANSLNGKKGYTESAGSYESMSRGSTLAAQGDLLLQSASDIRIQGSSISGLREIDERQFQAQEGTTLQAGKLNHPANGKSILENDAANLFITAGENRHNSYYEKEKFGVDYLGAIGGALTQIASVMTGTMTGDYSAPDELPEDVGIKRDGTEHRTESVTLTQSTIEDDRAVTLFAGNDINVIASQLASGGNMDFTAGGDVKLLAGLETLRDYQANYSNSFDSFTGGYDHGRLYAGIEGQRYREEILLEKGTALGSNIFAAGIVTMNVDGDVNVIGSDLTAGGFTANIGGDMTFGAAKEYERNTQTSTTETASLTAGIGNSYLDVAYAVDDTVKASEALKRAYDALQEAKDDPRISDLSDYEANVAIALLQQQAVALQAATATAGATENAFTYGFYGDVQMATDTTKQTDQSELLSHRGSNIQLSSEGMTLTGRSLSLQGSQLDIAEGGDLNLNVDRFTVEAVADTFNSRSKTESQSASLTLASSSRSNLAGAMALDALSGGLGKSESEQTNQSTTWQHSGVNVSGAFKLAVAEQTTINGGNVWANELIGHTGSLTVSSVQNTSTSDHRSRGINIGGGQGGSVNGGYNSSSGDSARGWVDQVSSLHGEQGFNLVVDEHTQVNGAVISGGEPSNFILNTNTFAYTDIQDYDRSDNSGWGVSTSFNPNDFREAQRTPQGSTTLNVNRNGHDKAGITRATVSEGNLIVRDQNSDQNSDLSGLNRDTDNIQIITNDEITGGLDVELTVDHRFATEKGRESIVEDLAGLPENAAAYGSEIVQLGGQAVMLTKAAYVKLKTELRVKVHNLPKEQRALGQGMEAAFDDYLRAGGDPEAYKTFLESDSFLDAAVTLSTIRDEIEALISQGLPANQIYAALESASPGATEENLGGFNLSDGYVNTTEGTTVGIEMFGAVDDLSIAIRRMEAEYGGAWLDSASIAFAVLISGPTRLVMEAGGDQLVQSLVGDQIDHVVESTANVMAGMAHHTDHQKIAELVDYGNEGFLTDEWTEETKYKLDTANDIDRTQSGAKETIKFLAATLIGVGGGKAVAAKGAKRGPKTDPNAPHNRKIREIGDQVEADGGAVVAGGGRLPEQLVRTPGGHKGGRRPDILYQDCKGKMCGVNVGRTKADGSPIKREQQALEDLNGEGLPTRFEPYD